MNLHTILATLLAVFWLSACKQEKSAEFDEAAIKKMGHQAVISLKTAFIGPLQSAMKSGGAAMAIPMCKNSAPALTEAAGSIHENMVIRRISSRLRNPDNAADATDIKILDIFQSSKDSESQIPTEYIHNMSDSSDPGNTIVRYYEPLMIQPLCLNCHGQTDDIKPEILELIKKLYPEDRATGYKTGDFRGLIRVDITLSD